MERKLEFAIWLATEPHVRSVELARALGCEMHALLPSDSRIPFRAGRYAYYCFKTFWLLLVRRPQIVFAQNPSIFLAAVVCFLKNFFWFKIVIDRHSNFKLDTVDSTKLKWRIFHWLSRYTVTRADLTIVTNTFFKHYVDNLGGHGFVLQDKMPSMDLARPVELAGSVNVVVVSTFSHDEPLDVVFETAGRLPADWCIYVTGRYQGKGRFADLVRNRPGNIRLTGFVPVEEYQGLLLAADVVVVLTTEENLLTCGAYEAISLGKALVLSDTEALRHYFRHGVVFVENTVDSLLGGIIEAVRRKEYLESDVLNLKRELMSDWQGRFDQLVAQLRSLS